MGQTWELRMRRGFTLVEMLIVVVVLVTLMSITFRLTSLGDSQKYRNLTIARMQRLENCLSGYYAAFGSYPPVRLHGTHNYLAKVNNRGIQDEDNMENTISWTSWNYIGENEEEERAWRQVRAACRAQPVGCSFPFPDGMQDSVRAISEQVQKKAQSSEGKYAAYRRTSETQHVLSSPFSDLIHGNYNGLDNVSDWRQVQIFRFGVMSFLLPRYYVMMSGTTQAHEALAKKAQWGESNSLPHCPYDGDEMSWHEVQRGATSDHPGGDDGYMRILNIPSQAVCARWLPNLEGMCACNYDLSIFGINIRTTDGGETPLQDSPYIDEYIYTVNNEEGGEAYMLDRITVNDGWHHELYYYSPPPYQTYTLWSGGANNRTFPPWISRENLGREANKRIGQWIEDDIIHMNN